MAVEWSCGFRLMALAFRPAAAAELAEPTRQMKVEAQGWALGALLVLGACLSVWRG